MTSTITTGSRVSLHYVAMAMAMATAMAMAMAMATAILLKIGLTQSLKKEIRPWWTSTPKRPILPLWGGTA